MAEAKLTVALCTRGSFFKDISSKSAQEAQVIPSIARLISWIGTLVSSMILLGGRLIFFLPIFPSTISSMVSRFSLGKLL
ncbi:hypothetical protein BMETH_1947_0 [methanotrophic bacterial endosymbiont of Bathymodiolus sp.]|nr:hypothetical protein BMETH_1947_0 [methanotrophic bacterial endosymbiont of Bathymodiolus sp.]